MWQQSTKASNDSDLDKVKCQQDSGDSGFLSGTSLISSEEVSSELESKNSPSDFGPPAVAPEPMRAPDSGVNFGLSESLSQLSLKHNALNSLDKVHTETPKLTPVSAKATDSSVPTSVDDPEDKSKIQYTSLEPWELYYTQDDDGDT